MSHTDLEARYLLLRLSPISIADRGFLNRICVFVAFLAAGQRVAGIYRATGAGNNFYAVCKRGMRATSSRMCSRRRVLGSARGCSPQKRNGTLEIRNKNKNTALHVKAIRSDIMAGEKNSNPSSPI